MNKLFVMAINPDHPEVSRLFESVGHVSKECLSWVLVYGTHHDRPGLYCPAVFTRVGAIVGSIELQRVKL